METVCAAYNHGLHERASNQPKVGPRDRDALREQLALMRKACVAVSKHGSATGGGSQYYAMNDAARKEYLVSCGGAELGTASSWYDGSVHAEFRILMGDSKVYKVQQVIYA